MSDDLRWRRLRPMPGLPYAEMLAEALKERGIPHYIARDWWSAAYGIAGASALGNQVFVFVPEEAWEEADALAEGLVGSGPQPDDGDSGTDEGDPPADAAD